MFILNVTCFSVSLILNCFYRHILLTDKIKPLFNFFPFKLGVKANQRLYLFWGRAAVTVTNAKHVPGRRGGRNSAAISRRLANRGHGQCGLVLTSDLECKDDDQYNKHEGQQYADDDECHPQALVVCKQAHVYRTHIHQRGQTVYVDSNAPTF